MKKLTPLLPFIICVLLAGCAGPRTVSPQGNSLEIQRETEKQRQLSYGRFVKDQTHLFDVTFPILKNNAAFCSKFARPLYGLTIWNTEIVPAKYKSTVKALYHLTPEITVQHVTKNSPASQAGLKPGDVFVSINGEPLAEGKAGFEHAKTLIKQSAYRTIEIYYKRKHDVFSALLTPIKGCNIPVLLENKSAINAYADGKKIVLTRGIMRFTESKDELALVIAHELAHNTMDHISKKQQNTIAGTLGGFAIDSLLAAAGVSTGNQFSKMGSQYGNLAHSVAFEQEADYVGMYFMARAGYDTTQVANFWRRMASEGGASIDHARTHPTSPQRFLAIERTHSEIRLKQRNHQKLHPNLKPQR